MSTKPSSLLTDPPKHIVYPCADENRIAEAVGTFAAAGLGRGEAVVLVTTGVRRVMIEHHLEAQGFDTKAFIATGQLAFLEASALLAAFMNEGMPDAELFKIRVEQVIEAASINPVDGQPRKVRIFGEMVSLLYMSSNVPAAVRLEGFWNQMVASHSISLFCAYSLKLESDRLPQSLLDAHTHDLSTVVN